MDAQENTRELSIAGARRGMEVTIHDVARWAGTSPSTVSRHLNGITVRPRTAEAIDAAIKASGFRVNSHARSLRTSQPNPVAFLMSQDIDSLFSDPVYAVLSRACIRALGETGRSMTMLLADNEEDRARTVEYLRGRHVSAVIVANYVVSGEPFMEQLQQVGIPVVVAGWWPDQSEVSCVASDAEGGIAEAVRHLRRAGRRRIGFLDGPTEADGSSQRFDAYRRHLGDLFDPELVLPGGKETADSVSRFLARGDVDAIVAWNDVMASAAIRALQRNGCRVPEDVAVIGYDNIASVAQATTPALTTVGQDFQAIGQQLVATVDALLAGEPNRATLVPTRLVVRDSA